MREKRKEKEKKNCILVSYTQKLNFKMCSYKKDFCSIFFPQMISLTENMYVFLSNIKIELFYKDMNQFQLLRLPDWQLALN